MTSQNQLPDYVKNTCPNCGGGYEFSRKEVGREWTCPHCNQPVLLRQKDKTWILAKWLIVSVISLCGALLVRFCGHERFSGVLAIDLASLIGTAFVPFAGAMLIAAFVKGRAGIVVGLVIAVAILALMLAGQR